MQRRLRQLLALLLALLLLPPLPEARAAGEAAGLRIAELMIQNRATLRDADGDFSDWVELENGGSRPVSLAGWALSDRAEGPGWALPALLLQPGERLLLFTDGKDRREGELHTDFALSAGETLRLIAPDGSTAHEAPCRDILSDRSLVYTDGGFVESLYPTPGYYDTAAGYNAFQEKCLPLGELQISEIVVFERKARFGEIYGNCDWVELVNRSDRELNLLGWTLSDGTARFALPDDTLLPGEYLLLRCSEIPTSEGDRRDVCTGFALSSENEQLYLYAPDGALVDWAAVHGVPYGGSFGRAEGRGGWCFFEKSTPGGDNGEGFRRVSAAPVSLTRDGVYEGVENVSVALAAEGDIYYTTNGSLPKRDDSLYTEPVSLRKSRVLRAVAIERDALPSPALNLTFIINEGHSLPIASLVTDSPSEYGRIYEGVNNYDSTLGALNWYDGDRGFSIGCDIKLNGETSRVLQKKNLSLRFRAVYGAKELNYDLFDGGIAHFTNLLLRSGQSYAGAVIKNELCCALAWNATENVMVQRFRYCVLYVNGHYNGIYALMEKTNEGMAAGILGLDRDSVTAIEANMKRGDGAYEDVAEPALNWDMSVEENYQRYCERVDIDSLIDWTIIEGWCANKDLLSGNIRYVRSADGDGKWRLMLYDLDATFSSRDYCFDLLSKNSRSERQIGKILNSLLQNASFRARLLERAGELLSGPLRDQALLDEIDRLEALLAPEIARNHAMLQLDSERWPRNLNSLRELCDGWAQHCVERLCAYLDVTEAERAAYFGAFA